MTAAAERERLDAHVAALVASAPPLSPAMKRTLAVLLRGPAPVSRTGGRTPDSEAGAPARTPAEFAADQAAVPALTIPRAGVFEPDALDVAQAFDAARTLLALGVPVFAARPDLQGGVWQPRGGHGGCGYWLPASWQQTVPTLNWLDPTVPGFEGKAWRPGWALAAVMGHGLDLLDIDPRNGGDASRGALVAAGHWPTAYAVADTPSGGTHEFVASLNVASLDNLMPGLDVKAGLPSGKGRGFAFIAPTVKAHKVTGALGAYRWRVRP